LSEQRERSDAAVQSMSRMCLIMFGAPGSGKGTQAKLLSEALGVPHISTGDMLRERIAKKDALGLEVEGILQAGKLVSDGIVNRLVAERIEQPDCAAGFILDGYPRTVNQAKVLTGVPAIAPLVVYLKVDYNVIVARLAGRRQCPVCGTVYNLSREALKVCKNDGSKLMIREDDREEVVRERLKAYETQTTPVLQFFRQGGYPCWEIEGEAVGGPPAIARRIQELVAEKLGGAAGIRA
jgi:adenylate kinase